MIEVKNLGKSYGEFSIQDVSFSVEKGSGVVIVGPKGAGKSLLVKLLLGIRKRDAGEISILGMDMPTDEMKIKKRLGTVFGNSSFHENMRPAEISRMMKNIYADWDDDIFKRRCQKYGLPPEDYLKGYTPPMRARLSVAVALSHKAELLIMDDPLDVEGLEAQEKSMLANSLAKYRENAGGTFLATSTGISDFADAADRVIVLHKGAISLDGRVADLAARKDEYGVLICSDEIYKEDVAALAEGAQKTADGMMKALIRKDKWEGAAALEPATLNDMLISGKKEAKA